MTSVHNCSYCSDSLSTSRSNVHVKKLCVFFSVLSFISITVFVYRQQTKDVYQTYLYPINQAFYPAIESRLDAAQEVHRYEKSYEEQIYTLQNLSQHARKMLLQDLCSSNMHFRGKWQTFDDIPKLELNNLLVDNRNGIIYCYVPKVACTAWKRIMIILSESLMADGVPYRDPADIPSEKVHVSVKHLNTYPKAVMKQKLEMYRKFVFVRNPFVRLISAYRDKFQKTKQYFYRHYGMDILRKFGNVSNPPESVEKAHADGIVPSFSSFIEYILSLSADGRRFDEHWRKTIHLCHPCLIDYDFIGKMETIDDDAAHLLKMLHVDHLVEFKPLVNSKTEPSDIKTWFANIPLEWRKKLYKIYEPDFRLFGYGNYDNDLDNASPENSYHSM